MIDLPILIPSYISIIRCGEGEESNDHIVIFEVPKNVRKGLQNSDINIAPKKQRKINS